MLIRVLFVLFVSGVPVLAQPASPATYVTDAELRAAMEKAAAVRPAMAVAPVKNSDHYRINLIRRTAAAGAIVHRPGTELHHIVEGSGTLVTGGSIVKGSGDAPATIEGGVSRRVQKGDVVLIPEGTPHWYSAVDGSVVYLEVRFNVPVE